MPVRVFTEKEKEEIKSKMLEAGFALIKQYGLTHTSVTKITESAGIGKSTFYNFYESKELFVIDLIKYERIKAMEMIQKFLNGRPKMTEEEGKKLFKLIISHQDSIYQYLTEEDMKTLYPVMLKEGMIEDDLNSDTPDYLLSIVEGVRPGVDSRIFLNFIRMLAICVSQKESLNQDVLQQNIDMIFDKLFEYLFEDN